MTENLLISKAFHLEEWVVEPTLGRVVRGQVVVPLRPRVMELLLLLVERAGEVVTKREIVDRVWSSGFVTDNTVVHCVNELREALGDTCETPRCLQTIPRRGYRFLGRIQPLGENEDPPRVEAARYELLADGWSAFLVDGENIIGRGGDVQIGTDSARVSRHHARILVSSGGAVIEDLGSLNGTFVGGRRIEGPMLLTDLDEVRIGDVVLLFRCREPKERTTVGRPL